jgi:hypothetical protein
MILENRWVSFHSTQPTPYNLWRITTHKKAAALLQRLL